MDPIAPGNHERAWNDPPKFAFNASNASTPAGPGGRRRLLNKRVPVPIGPSSCSSPMTPIMRPTDTPPTMGSTGLHSPVAGPPLVHPPTVKCVSDTKAEDSMDSAVSEVEDCRDFHEILEDVEVSLKNSLHNITDELKDNVREEISKRLHMMKTMWLEEKLNTVVHKRMLALSRALTRGEYDIAWTLHQGLIVDYTTVCSPWMVGVKTLIAECRNQSKQRAANETSCVSSGEGEEEGEKKEEALGISSNTGEDGNITDAVDCDSAANIKGEASKVHTSE